MGLSPEGAVLLLIILGVLIAIIAEADIARCRRQHGRLPEDIQ